MLGLVATEYWGIQIVAIKNKSNGPGQTADIAGSLEFCVFDFQVKVHEFTTGNEEALITVRGRSKMYVQGQILALVSN